MNQTTKQNHYKNFLKIAFAFTAIKILAIYFSQLPLWADEAQYWVWSKNLDFGYYSKPPLIAWVISLFTNIFGNSEFAVRLPSSLIHFATAIVVFKIAEKLFSNYQNSERVPFYSGLIFLFSSGVTFSSHFFSTDSLLIFFWALATLYVVKALAKNKLKHWLIVGFAVGFGLLSKYTVVLFYPSLFLFLLLSKPHQKLLVQKNFWLSGVVALAIFAPNIIWNFNNGLVSLHHTEDNVLTGGVSLYPRKLVEFFGAQFLVFGVLTFLLYLIYLAKNSLKIFTIDYSQKILLFLSLPLLLTGLAISLISGAQAHWIAPLYIFASIQIAYFFSVNNNVKFLKTANYFNFAIAILFLVFVTRAENLQLNYHIKFLTRLNIWNDIAMPAKQELAKNPNAVILVDERKSAATLLYNLKDENGNLPQVYKWNEDAVAQDYFDMKFNFSSQKNKDAILVTRGNDLQLQEYFDSSIKIENTDLPKGFSMFYLKNFKGYSNN
jgi:4-amino-4-deoxy-L-arabinose transferase-like glycosyltransferase